MLTEVSIIEPHLGNLVNGAKVQKNLFTRKRFGQFKIFFVNIPFVLSKRSVHARKSCFGRKRNDDFGKRLGDSFFLYTQIPSAAKRKVGVTLHLRARIFHLPLVSLCGFLKRGCQIYRANRLFRF